jgi:hypothetical protein
MLIIKARVLPSFWYQMHWPRRGLNSYPICQITMWQVFDTSVWLDDISSNNNVKILNNYFQPIEDSLINFKLNNGKPCTIWIDYGLDIDFKNTMWVYMSQNVFSKPSKLVIKQSFHIPFENKKTLFWVLCKLPCFKFRKPLVHN